MPSTRRIFDQLLGIPPRERVFKLLGLETLTNLFIQNDREKSSFLSRLSTVCLPTCSSTHCRSFSFFVFFVSPLESAGRGLERMKEEL